ncbi:MAG: T9SS type A sorting domain-containing protein [Saprospiraceae bacterium]|nr:T9SS type A sorting domain-containing protein [Saprospiraceae bacterium]
MSFQSNEIERRPFTFRLCSVIGQSQKIQWWSVFFSTIFLLVQIDSLAQNCNPNGGTFPSCISGPDDCNAADLQLCAVPGYIADLNGDPITSCNPGELITAQVFICVFNNAASAQNGIRIAASMDLGGGQVINVLDCFADQIPPNGTLNIAIGTYTFTCGACISFTDFVLGYNTNAGCQCSDVTNPNGTFECPAKCEWIGDLNIPPLTPLGVSCPADVNVACIDDTTSVSQDSLAIVQGLIADCNPVTITLISRTDQGACGTPPGRTITRVFEITDGITTLSCTRRNFILDQTPPTFICPPPPSGTCALAEVAPYADLNEFLNAGGTATDNCGLDVASFTHVGDQSNGMTCPITYTRTYQISDLCGNPMSCTQSIVIDDNTPPTLNCPNDVNVSCFGQVPAPYQSLSAFENDQGQATDNCAIDGNSFVLVEEIQTGICPTAITREYRINDLCGNPGTCIQTITVDDNEGPTLTCPANQNLSCRGEVPDPVTSYAAFLIAGGSAMDNCGIDESTFRVDPDEIMGTCPTTISRTYYLQDSCQNEGSCTQTFTIFDQDPPTINCPLLGPFDCLAAVPPPYPNYLSFTAAGGSSSDNCGIVASTFTLLSESGPTGSCPMTIIRTYTISDSCSNQITCTQTITIDDNTLPIINCPSGGVVACSGNLGAPYSDLAAFLAAGGTVSDNCGIDATTFALDDQVSSGSCPTTITRTYGISDTCGNRSRCIQTLMVSDQTPPSLTCPGPLSFECVEDVPTAFVDYNAFVNAGGSASDNCGLNANSFSVVESVTGICPMVISRTYSMMDICGNSGFCTQVITVQDLTAPTFGICPTNQVLGCIDHAPTTADLPISTETITSLGITDNCQSSLSLSYHDYAPIINNCSYIFTRRFYAVDACANIDSCDQMFFFTMDTTAPIISGLEDIEDIVIIGCDDIFPAAPVVSAFDDCVGTIPVDFQQSANGGGCLGDGMTRRWSVTDPCGNTREIIQYLYREDLSAPVLQRGPDTTLQCGEEIPENVYDIEDDGCTLVQHEFREEVVNGDCSCTYTLLRIWTIWDACNTVIDTQTIHIIDSIAPDIALVNPNLVGIENGASITSYVCDLPQVDASDIQISDCCEIGDVETYDLLVASDVCQVFGYYRRWKCGYIVTDLCGNQSEFSFFMDQYDTLAPKISVDSNFMDYMLACGDPLPKVPEVEVLDNCTPGLELSLKIDTIGIDQDTFAIVRTWEASDSCGNLSNIRQVISYCGFDVDSFAGTIGNVVWLDENKDGIQDPYEIGVNGVLVNLYLETSSDGNPTGLPIKSVITQTRDGHRGSYYFSNLHPGAYVLQFVPGEEYQFTEAHMGVNADLDSDVDPLTGTSQRIVVTPGIMDISVDAGLILEEISPAEVQITQFSVRTSDCVQELNWSAISSDDNVAVAIEHSLDGAHYEKIGAISLQPNSTKSYEYFVRAVKTHNYYRLHWKAGDGTSSYSESIYTINTCQRIFEIKAFPNPAREKVTLTFEGATGKHLFVELFDVMGRKLIHERFRTYGLRGQVDLSFNNLPLGTYWVKVSDQINVQQMAIVKMD